MDEQENQKFRTPLKNYIFPVQQKASRKSIDSSEYSLAKSKSLLALTKCESDLAKISSPQKQVSPEYSFSLRNLHKPCKYPKIELKQSLLKTFRNAKIKKSQKDAATINIKSLNLNSKPFTRNYSTIDLKDNPRLLNSGNKKLIIRLMKHIPSAENTKKIEILHKGKSNNVFSTPKKKKVFNKITYIESKKEINSRNQNQCELLLSNLKKKKASASTSVIDSSVATSKKVEKINTSKGKNRKKSTQSEKTTTLLNHSTSPSLNSLNKITKRNVVPSSYKLDSNLIRSVSDDQENDNIIEYLSEELYGSEREDRNLLLKKESFLQRYLKKKKKKIESYKLYEVDHLPAYHFDVCIETLMKIFKKRTQRIIEEEESDEREFLKDFTIEFDKFCGLSLSLDIHLLEEYFTLDSGSFSDYLAKKNANLFVNFSIKKKAKLSIMLGTKGYRKSIINLFMPYYYNQKNSNFQERFFRLDFDQDQNEEDYLCSKTKEGGQRRRGGHLSSLIKRQKKYYTSSDKFDVLKRKEFYYWRKNQAFDPKKELENIQQALEYKKGETILKNLPIFNLPNNGSGNFIKSRSRGGGRKAKVDFVNIFANSSNTMEILLKLVTIGEKDLFMDTYSKNKSNFDINTQDENGNTLLIHSTMLNIINIAEYLLDQGADPNIPNCFGNTAMHYAYSFKNFKVVDLLHRYGAREDIINRKGMTPGECINKNCEKDSDEESA